MAFEVVPILCCLIKFFDSFIYLSTILGASEGRNQGFCVPTLRSSTDFLCKAGTRYTVMWLVHWLTQELAVTEVCLRAPRSSSRGSPPTSHKQESSDLCWSSVEFMPPERSQQEANVTCPEKLIPGLKTTVAFKAHRENKRFQQIFF